MSNLVVITFDDADEAMNVHDTLKSGEAAGFISLDDMAVVTKNEEGEVHVSNEVDRGVKVGAIGGGALGLLIGTVFFPVAGLALGAIGGALVGKLADTGVDKKMIENVKNDLQPGTSAIFFLVREANPDAAIAALKPYKGNVYATSLPPEAEEQVRAVLKKRF
jgi:uncharacterized membrane protein